MDEPIQIKKRAIDVVPYLYGIWCTVADSEPFINTVATRRWSEDGKKIWFMLDSHNFMSAEPEEEIDVVERKPTCSNDLLQDVLRRDREAMMKRPSPRMTCPTCNQEIKP